MSYAQFAKAAAGGVRVALSARNVSDSQVASVATAGYALTNSGEAQSFLSSGTDTVEAWISNPALVSNYECRATLDSGSLQAGSSATGSWLALSTTRSWSVVQSVAGTASASLTIEIRHAASGAVLTSAAVSLEATVF